MMISNNIYSPYGLNFYTCFAFLGSSLFAIYRNQYILALACLVCLLLGLWNHATYHPLISKIDKIFNYICFPYFIITCYAFNWYYFASLVFATVMAYIYTKYSYSTYGVVMHSVVHILGNVGIILMTEGISIGLQLAAAAAAAENIK
jgi:hypothetical protein